MSLGFVECIIIGRGDAYLDVFSNFHVDIDL